MDRMIGDAGNLTTQERFAHLLKLISSERFLKMQGLGNEVPFFICPYPANEAVAMGKMERQLASRLEQQGVRVLVVNLYDLCIELLQQRGIWERLLQIEPTVSKEELKELLQGVLDPERHVVPAIAAKMRACDFDVLFIGTCQ